MRLGGGIAGSLLMLLSTVGASADDTHYRAIPIGAHAISLGGAFTGVADDVSAAYFNPGGLALGRTAGIAGGLTINAWERVEIDALLEQPGASSDATDRSGRTVPIFIGAAIKFGERDETEERKNTLAISVVEPIFTRFGVLVTVEADPLELSDSYKIQENDRATWYGISYARRLSLWQSFGASLYLSVRRLNHTEVGISQEGGTPVPDTPSYEGISSAVNSESLGFSAFHFVFRFGWLYRIKPQLQLGIMVQAPGIPLRQRVNVFSQVLVNDNRDPTTPVVTTPSFLDKEVDANLPIPGELEVGLEYWPAEKVMLAFDVSFHAPVPSRSRVDLPNPEARGGLFFSTDTGRRATGNVAIAGDFFINNKISVSTGFFTDLSSAKKIPADPTRYYNARNNRLGGTLSLGLNVSGVALAVGSTFIYGRGDATGAVVDLNNFAVDYNRTQGTSRIVYLHVTGATQAATDLGTRAQQGIKARRDKKKANDED